VGAGLIGPAADLPSVRQRRPTSETHLTKTVKVPQPRTLGHVVASRQLRLPGEPKRTVTVRIRLPRRLRNGWDWGCPVEITGLDAPKIRYLFGVDAFQALQLGLDYIAIRTSTAGVRPFWFEPEDGTGFTRSLPSYLPVAVQQKLQALVDKAGVQWARQQKRKATRRRRKRS
jgi:hypothetical protein